MGKGRKKIPLVYVPYGILLFDCTELCHNPEFVTGRRDSFCVLWGRKCKILHCWAPIDDLSPKESDWLRGEVQYLVEVKPTTSRERSWWISWWSRFVYETSEDVELYPTIQVTSREQLNKLHGKP